MILLQSNNNFNYYSVTVKLAAKRHEDDVSHKETQKNNKTTYLHGEGRVSRGCPGIQIIFAPFGQDVFPLPFLIFHF
jgi:hypothetical protein